MNQDDCFELGYISKVHGTKGEVMAELDTDNPTHYKKLDGAFLLLKNQLVPFLIEKISILKSQAIIKFGEIGSIEQASGLKGVKIFLPMEKLPELKNDEYYLHELIGLDVTDRSKGPLGMVTQVYNLPNNDLMAINYQSCEVLVPINDQFIIKVDKKNKCISVDLPDGLVEVYTQASSHPDDGEDDDN